MLQEIKEKNEAAKTSINAKQKEADEKLALQKEKAQKEVEEIKLSLAEDKKVASREAEAIQIQARKDIQYARENALKEKEEISKRLDTEIKEAEIKFNVAKKEAEEKIGITNF